MMRVLFYTQLPDVTYGISTFPSEGEFGVQWVHIDSLDGHYCDLYSSHVYFRYEHGSIYYPAKLKSSFVPNRHEFFEVCIS